MTGRRLYDFACDTASIHYPSTVMVAWTFLDETEQEFWNCLARRVGQNP